MLVIRLAGLRLRFVVAPPRSAGIGNNPRSKSKMLNLVEKFTPAVEATEADGVVAIEYVVVAGAVVVALAGLFAFGLGDILTGKILDILDTF
jgi:hypothetical protein